MIHQFQVQFIYMKWCSVIWPYKGVEKVPKKNGKRVKTSKCHICNSTKMAILNALRLPVQ